MLESRIDLILLLVIMMGAFFYLRTTPEFAANLPQDAADFSIPSVTFLETGYLGVTMYDKPAPTGHPIGMPILLMPSYIILGHFIGNGIYMILLCALGILALVYYIGRAISGRLAGFAAAMFLATHHGFRLYSQKIMSEIPALFLITAALALLLYAHKHARSNWPYLLLGVSVGLAIIMRSENILLAIPIGVLCLMRLIRINLRRGILIAVGLFPWLTLQAVYNRANYGSPFRTGYHWIGWFEQPSFALHNATAHGYWTLTRHYPERFEKNMDGNFLVTVKTILSQSDQSLVFGPSSLWNGRPQSLYAALILLRALLGGIGFIYCLVQWKKRPEVKTFLVWATILMATTAVFYTFFSWQEERYLLRLVSLFCILDGLAAAAILDVVHRACGTARAEVSFVTAGAICVLAAILACLNSFGLVYNGDDNLYLYQAMRTAAGSMEPNAVIVTDWDPVRIDIHMVRGTSRRVVPLAKRFGWDRWPKANSQPVPMYPFAVLEEPDKLIAMMQQGRTAYVLLRDPFDFQASPPELAALGAQFDVTPVATFKAPSGQPIGHYLLRLTLRDANQPRS